MYLFCSSEDMRLGLDQLPQKVSVSPPLATMVGLMLAINLYKEEADGTWQLEATAKLLIKSDKSAKDTI